jgi:hypothetical protein
MAQTGYTPILIYSSSTTTNAPAAGSLTNSTLGSELAINITDGKLFYKDNTNAVQVIAWKTTPTTAGGTGLTSYTAGDLLYYASGTTLTRLGIGSAYQALQVNAGGTAPSWQASATSTLTAQGDLLYASAANTLARLAKNTTATRYLSNTGSSNNPAWAQIDLTNGVTGTLPIGNGGTGQTSYTANGIVFASGATTLATGTVLVFDGTNAGLGASSPTDTNSWSRCWDIRGTSTTNYSGIYMGNSNATVRGYIGAGGASGAGIAYVGTASNDPFQVYTNNTLRASWDTSGNYTVNNGNVVIGTSGKGIDFSATAGTGTSELLADYEEGDWTPVVRVGSPTGTQVTTTTTTAKYTKIGRFVRLEGYITRNDATAHTGDMYMTGMPFTGYTNEAQIGGGAWFDNSPSTDIRSFMYTNGTSMYFPVVGTTDTLVTVQSWDNNRYIYFSINYMT